MLKVGLLHRVHRVRQTWGCPEHSRQMDRTFEIWGLGLAMSSQQVLGLLLCLILRPLHPSDPRWFPLTRAIAKQALL